MNSKDAENKTPLHYAIENQHPTIITLLLSVPEINLSLRDKSGLTPFATALTFRNNKAAQSILDKMPSAAEQVRKFEIQAFTQLVPVQVTLFLFLVRCERSELSSYRNQERRSRKCFVSFIGQRRREFPCTGRDDDTAASFSSPKRQRNVSTKFDTSWRSHRRSRRSQVSYDCRFSAVRLKKYVFLYRQTALHVASEAGNAPVVAALLQNNADFDALDVNGDNALHVAIREGHLNVVSNCFFVVRC